MASPAPAPAPAPAPPSTAAMSNRAEKQRRVKVVPQLDCELPHFELVKTPSAAHGVSRELEASLRIAGCELIQTAGILLKCNQVRIAGRFK